MSKWLFVQALAQACAPAEMTFHYFLCTKIVCIVLSLVSAVSCLVALSVPVHMVYLFIFGRHLAVALSVRGSAH